MLEARQLKLISELQSIYPIEQLDINGDYAIRGIIILFVCTVYVYPFSGICIYRD